MILDSFVIESEKNKEETEIYEMAKKMTFEFLGINQLDKNLKINVKLQKSSRISDIYLCDIIYQKK